MTFPCGGPRRPVVRPRPALGAENAIDSRSPRFDNVAPRTPVDKSARLYRLRKFENPGRGEPKLTQNSLGISAVVFQPGPIGTAANDVEPVMSQPILKLSPPLSLIHISEPTRLLSISYAVFCL